MSFEGEDNDEEILYVFRKAVITNVGWLVVSAFLLMAPVFFNSAFLYLTKEFPDVFSPSLIFIINTFWYIFTFGYMFERFIHWFFNIHIITNKRIMDMDFDSLLHRNITDAPLRNIEDITYTISGALETVFNFGTVTIQTAAEQRELEFLSVADPAKIQDVLSDLVSQKRRKHER
jgi:membrane protein YdbS with pleckstrin-like domain